MGSRVRKWHALACTCACGPPRPCGDCCGWGLIPTAWDLVPTDGRRKRRPNNGRNYGKGGSRTRVKRKGRTERVQSRGPGCDAHLWQIRGLHRSDHDTRSQIRGRRRAQVQQPGLPTANGDELWAAYGRHPKGETTDDNRRQPNMPNVRPRGASRRPGARCLQRRAAADLATATAAPPPPPHLGMGGRAGNRGVLRATEPQRRAIGRHAGCACVCASA